MKHEGNDVDSFGRADVNDEQRLIVASSSSNIMRL